MVRKALGGLAAAALLMSSTVASAATTSASKLSLANAPRASTTVGESNEQAGGFPFLIVAVVIAVGVGLYFAVSDDDDSN
jgi:cytochrome c-type biogenesis protein CcmH/NrfG